MDTLNEISQALNNDPNAFTTLTTLIGTKSSLTENNVFTGTQAFQNTLTLNNDVIANSVTISPTRLSNLQYLDISSSLVSLLNAKANSSECVMLTGSQDISGNKTFTNGLRVTSGAVSFPNGSINQAAIASLVSDLHSKQNTLTFDSTPTNSSLNPVTSGGIFTALNNKQDINTALLLTGNQTVTGVKTFFQIVSLDFIQSTKIFETVSSLSTSSNQLTINLTSSSLPSIIYVASASANFQVVLTTPTNIQNGMYTVTIIINNRFFGNTITVNGAAVTPISANGTITINSSAVQVMQTFSVMFISGAVSRVYSSVQNLW